MVAINALTARICEILKGNFSEFEVYENFVGKDVKKPCFFCNSSKMDVSREAIDIFDIDITIDIDIVLKANTQGFASRTDLSRLAQIVCVLFSGAIIEADGRSLPVISCSVGDLQPDFVTVSLNLSFKDNFDSSPSEMMEHFEFNLD